MGSSSTGRRHLRRTATWRSCAGATTSSSRPTRNTGTIAGFVSAHGDGVLSAYIPLLEVLPAYQGRGMGTELVRRLLELLKGHYMIDLACDEDLVPFYERFGMKRWVGMGLRNHNALAE